MDRNVRRPVLGVVVLRHADGSWQNRNDSHAGI